MHRRTHLRGWSGGMRVAIESAAPEGVQGVLNQSVRFCRILQTSNEVTERQPIPPDLPAYASICQHLPAYASICQHFHRTVSAQNIVNNDKIELVLV